MDPMFSEALQYIHQLQTKLTGDARQIYAQFVQILNQFRRGTIDSSIVTSFVQKLFQTHPDLLHAFKPFAPTHCSAIEPAGAALPAEGSDKRVCVDFVNRVWARFGGGEVYWKFSDCMHAYSREEISAADACDKVVGLFGCDDDLVAEFMRFVPGSCVRGEGSKKRKIIDHHNDNGNDHDQSRMGKRRRGSDSGSLDDPDISAAAPPRWKLRKSGNAAAAKRIADRDNEMEDSLCDVDVRIGNLESVVRKALSLADRRLSPADTRIEEVFTPLNLGFIRKLDRKIVGRMNQHVLHGWSELMEILTRKKASLEKERLRIVQKWNNARTN